MKRLIVNADDFGMTAGVNHAVMQAHRHGLVTSTSLMAAGDAFAAAVDIARQSSSHDVLEKHRSLKLCHPERSEAQPSAVEGPCVSSFPAPGSPTLVGFAGVGRDISVGCHVVLLEGRPVLPPDKIPRLAVTNGDGHARFQRGLGEFIRAATTGRLPAEEIVRESTAQIRKIQSAGLAVSHVDTHKHAHVFPEVFRPLMRAAAACGVRAMRNPFEPAEAMRWGEMLRRPILLSRYLPVRTLRVFASEFRWHAAQHGIATPDGTLGITLTGFLNEHLLMRLLQHVPDGTWELCCHPAYEDAQWRALGPRPGSGQRELELFSSPLIRRRVEQMGFELISYTDLVQERHRAAA